MTIINRAMFPLSNGINNIMSMKERYDKLQTQLSSGQKASNLAEMGSNRYFDLALRARVSRIESYQENIKTVDLRLNVLDQTVSRLDTIEADARAATMAGTGGQASLNFQTTPSLAAARLDEVMTLLNVDVAGRYMFGGAKTEQRPVEDAYYVMNGRGGLAGYKQIAGERKLADLGTTHMGRLAVSTVTDTVTLAEDGTHPFGMKLSGLTSSSANINLTAPAGAPPSLSVQFGATLPVQGDTVTISLTMPDGTSEAITLTAVSEPGDPGSYVIGPDADTTAANFSAALAQRVQTMAEGTMVTASAYAASENFFYGQGGQPMRVDGPPYDTATALIPGTTADTIFWYKGEDSTDPRHTITAKVGESTTVAYGVQANEYGLVNLVQSLAAMSIQVFTESDTTSAERYSSMISRNTERLAESGDTTGSIAVISVELGLAKSTAGTINERHTDQKAQLNNMAQDLEQAPTEEVAMELLALKTRLEASYQTTAMLSQLSLINYMK